MVRLNEDDTQADSCAICKFWDCEDSYGLNGLCRRYPPEAGRFVPTGDGRMEWMGSVSPRTVESDWCGEYIAKGEENV